MVIDTAADPLSITVDDLRGALVWVRQVANARFQTSNPDRLAQLDGALATADMAVDHLFTETPYLLA